MPKTAARSEPEPFVLRSEEVMPVTAKFVVVAFVVVALPIVNLVTVDDACDTNPLPNNQPRLVVSVVEAV